MGRSRELAEGTAFRLDTVDIAVESGWQFEHTSRTDEFSKDDVTVTVQYSAEDDINSLTRSGKRSEDEVFGPDSPGKQDRLRIWLTGRASAAAKPGVVGTSGAFARPRTAAEAPRSAKIESHLRPSPENWTIDEFVGAVTDPYSRAFLLKLLELAYANDQLASERYPFRLWFGKRNTGSMFVYPFGRRYSPFKFSVESGRLMISGCWRSYRESTGKKEHPGFAPVARMLGQTEHGTASEVPVTGLDADEVWKVGEAVSQAVNG